ncbi:hypothetical protein J2T07_003246 [Luteibacter jiangsuensis]|uniref:Uncharacterized protein n=1 Tax=Luteibacter jiangsuensis TaxID=637577 RepID=A0ABT9T184_9GAMM|nr:hypothetical protein [Luteibacter jiangsuensis]MDQ0011040.1 hypothetical protein [Luteibacter jiangsuensis]
MKSHLRLAFLAGLVPIAATAGDSRDIDIYRELVRFRSQHLGAERAFGHTTHAFLSQLADDPTSFYAEPSETPAITNEIWWTLFLDGLPSDPATLSRTALDALKWQSGLSKALPGVDVLIDDQAIAAYRGREVAANARKAGIDPDIFWQAADMNGSMKTIAAGYAVALQILRDQMKAYDPADYGRRAIKPDVLQRYMAQSHPGRITEHDKRYLQDILRYEIRRNGTVTDADSRHALPAAYRVARTAAAYADQAGYANAQGFCTADRPLPWLPRHPAEMEYHQPLCFIAATDRAVQAWYRRELRQEEAILHRRGHTTSSPIMRLIAGVLAWVDVVSFIEVVEAVVAEDLVGIGALDEADAELAANRSTRLTCRIDR